MPGIFFYIFDDGSKAVDVDTFRKWARICKEGINAEGRSYVIFAEFGSRTYASLHRYGTDDMTMPASSVYEYGYPARYRLIDVRLAGKSFHNSEFGVLAADSKPEDFEHMR